MSLDLSGYELHEEGIYIKKGFSEKSVKTSMVALITYYKVPNAKEVVEQLQKENLKERLPYPLLRDSIRRGRNEFLEFIDSNLPTDNGKPGDYLTVRLGYYSDRLIEGRNRKKINRLFFRHKKKTFGPLWSFNILYGDFTPNWVDKLIGLLPQELQEDKKLVEESQQFLNDLLSNLDDPGDLFDLSGDILEVTVNKALKDCSEVMEHQISTSLFLREIFQKAFSEK